MPEVEAVFFETGQEAFRRFKAENPESALGEYLTPDQFPESFRVKLRDPAKRDAVVAACAGRAGVERVSVAPGPTGPAA